MEYGNSQTANCSRINGNSSLTESEDELICRRLDMLLEENARIAREKSIFSSEREKLASELMKNPLSLEKTFACFGTLLGIFPPSAFFLRFIFRDEVFLSQDLWILGITSVIVLISAVVGYLSGKLIGDIVFELEKKSWVKMLSVLPFIGILWGIMAGGAGGVIIFGIGAFFGAAIGSLVGAVALTVFSFFHRLLKRGDKIELKHFLPLAFGIAFFISAFFLGL